jgi:hypothetical protein
MKRKAGLSDPVPPSTAPLAGAFGAQEYESVMGSDSQLLYGSSGSISRDNVSRGFMPSLATFGNNYEIDGARDIRGYALDGSSRNFLGIEYDEEGDGDEDVDDIDSDDEVGETEPKKRTKNTRKMSEQQRIERREKNREHAKRSRVRKKIIMESMQDKVRLLRTANEKLRTAIRTHLPDECNDLLRRPEAVHSENEEGEDEIGDLDDSIDSKDTHALGMRPPATSMS